MGVYLKEWRLGSPGISVGSVCLSDVEVEVEVDGEGWMIIKVVFAVIEGVNTAADDLLRYY